MENWRPAPGWPSYLVSDLGNVRRVGRGRLKPTPNAGGYLKVHLSEPGSKPKKVSVHRLVCEAFNGPPPSPDMTDVLHGPLGKSINIPSNVRWGNDQQNYADRTPHGEGGLLNDFQHKPGELHRFARLTRHDVELIRSLAGSVPQREIADRFSISQSHVSDIVNHKRWRA